jgi:ubiquinol-cytochrome c reductase iron-sulfur subunit
MSDQRKASARRKTLVRLSAAAGGVAAAGAAVPFLASLAELQTVEWPGRPVWILKRTPEMLQRLPAAEPLLSNPRSAVGSQQPEYARNATRSIEPEVLVTVALCTHLGCIPTYYPAPDSVQPGWLGGFYCPCHGSKFDLAGRVYRGSPAPTNLEIPPHRYLSPEVLLIGDDRNA